MNKPKPHPLDFREPENNRALAELIGIDEATFEHLCNKDAKNIFFERIKIPKRRKNRAGEYRIVWRTRIERPYKSFARRFDLFTRLADNRYPHDSAYGYVRGRNIIENASVHTGAPLILHADIENFFPSITSERLQIIFGKLGVHKNIINSLAEFLTIDGTLPLGLHPSPMLANIVCLDLDDKFKGLAEKYNCKYTRYADDITFSGQVVVPAKQEVKEILESEGFNISDRKFRITKCGQAHYVTGLSVTDPIYPRAPRMMKRKLRQTLYYCKTFGIREHLRKTGWSTMEMQAGVNHIDGMVRYISHIERESWPSLRQEWKDILLDNDERPSYEPLIEREIRHLHFFIDETEINYESKNILALAFVITEDANKVNASTLATLRDYLDKAFVGGNKEKLRKEGLHYSAADEDLRNSYIEKLPVLPFDGYLIYGELGNYSSYEDLYLSLIRKILPHRLMWCNYSAVRIIFEENKSKVSPEKIKQVVATVYNELLATNNRRPIQEPEVIIGKKAEYPGFSVPDFLLALFSKYARQNDRKLDKNYANIVDREERQFERLRDKYRLIIDADNKKVYKRNRPFSPWLKGDNKNAAVA